MTSPIGAPEVGALVPFSLPAVERTTVATGLATVLIPSGSIPKTYVRLVLGFGTGSEGPDETWLTRLVGDYLKEGAGDLDSTGLADAVACMGGRLSINVDEDTTTIGSSVLSEFAPDLIRLLATVAREPRFPKSELERLTADLGRRLDLATSQPGTLAASAFRRALYGDHPYGRLLATTEQITSFTTVAVRASYEAHAGPDGAHLYVAGIFDRAAVLEAAHDAFDGWQGAATAAPAPPTTSSTRTIHLVNRPGAEQSTLSIGLPVPNPRDDDYVALSVTNSLLGGSFYSRITLNIREDKGYTYSPRSQVVTHPGDAYWVELADVTTDVTGASMHEIFGEIDRLRAEPPDAEELEGIQNYVAGSYVLRHATPGGILDQLGFLDLHGLEEDWAARYTDRVLALTTSDVQRIATDHLRPADMTIAIVGDAEAIADEIAPYGEVVDAPLA
jgi:zinc protease